MSKPPLNQPEKPADQFRLLNRCISNQTTFAFPHNQWFDIFYSLNFALFSPHCLLGFRLSGSPSGHAMGSAGVGNVMVTAVLSIVAARKLPPLQYRSVWDICALSSRLKALISHLTVISACRSLQLMLWMLLGLVELLVCMSRVYLAAHFPHQVISGVISGGLGYLLCVCVCGSVTGNNLSKI